MFGAIKRGLRMVVPLKVNLVKNAFVYIQRMKVKNITGHDEKFLKKVNFLVSEHSYSEHNIGAIQWCVNGV
jgi:hypothetical protein